MDHASRPTILRPHHFVAGAWSFHHFTTDHTSPQLHSPASDTGTAAGSGSGDDGDDGMLPCMYIQYLRHPWAPAASMGTTAAPRSRAGRQFAVAAVRRRQRKQRILIVGHVRVSRFRFLVARFSGTPVADSLARFTTPPKQLTYCKYGMLVEIPAS